MRRACCIWAALPGAQALAGFGSCNGQWHMACTDVQVILYRYNAGANRAPKVNNILRQKWSFRTGFFKDFSGSCRQNVVLAQFKIISDRGASASDSLVLRKLCFRIELTRRAFRCRVIRFTGQFGRRLAPTFW